MGRDETIARETIHDLCYSYKLDEEKLYKRAFLLLDSYRKLCFKCYLDHDEVDDSIYEDSDPMKAILYLEKLKANMNRGDCVRAIRDRVEKNWIVELVDSAMIKVQEFPQHGKLYLDLINKRFLVQVKYPEEDIYHALCLGRSRYYDRRWEAVMVFGICLWGSVLPNMKRELLDK